MALAQVLPCSQLIFQLNPAHQDLSNNTKGTLQFLWNFQVWFNLIFSEEIIQYSRTSTSQVQTKPLHPSSSRAFQRDQEHDLKHPRSVDLIATNKTNKLPCFIDRFYICDTVLNHTSLALACIVCALGYTIFWWVSFVLTCSFVLWVIWELCICAFSDISFCQTLLSFMCLSSRCIASMSSVNRELFFFFSMVDWGFKWQLLAIFGGRMFNYFGQHAAWGRGPTKEIGIYRL